MPSVVEVRRAYRVQPEEAVQSFAQPHHPTVPEAAVPHRVEAARGQTECLQGAAQGRRCLGLLEGPLRKNQKEIRIGRRLALLDYRAMRRRSNSFREI